MRADIAPRRVPVSGRAPIVFTVTVTNTVDVISGYTLRVLGLDPSWVQIDQPQLSLFPGATGEVAVTVRPPAGLPAGEHRFAVQVRELTPPQSTTILDVDLEVPDAPAVRVRLDPVSVTAGRTGHVGLLVNNDGNTTVRGTLVGTDDEEKIRYRFDPAVVEVGPGEHAAVELRLRARRKLAGQPIVRTFQVSVDDGRGGDAALRPRTNGSFMQKPVIARGALSLLGLLASITVFALVITYALSNVVGRSAADRDLALQVAQAQQQAGAGGTASASGTVRQLTTNATVAGVDVAVFAASDTADPLATAATDKSGVFHLDNLAAGSYKLRFRGAGFSDLWYPQSPTDAAATAVTVQAGQELSGLDVRIGGLPATISGTVVAPNASGAQVTLQVPGSPQKSGGAAAAAAGAVLQTAPVGSNGAFALANVPSPGVYDLVATAPGFATQTQRIDVSGGEDRNDVQIQLQKGDGSIAGTVTGGRGPIGSATITATYGQTTVQAVSSATGAFTLTALPTPASFTVVVGAPGYASQTLTLTLTSGQRLTGVGVTLGGAAGSLQGTVTANGVPAPGVTVTVSNGVLTVPTVTQTTGHPGFWQVQGLTVPSTYTVTLSRDDLASQTISVSIDAYGTATTSATPGASVSDAGIAVDMRSATATLRGVTRQLDATGASVATGEVLVTVSSGNATYTQTSASVPAAAVGTFELDHLPPGTYTITVSRHGSRPTSSVVALAAGDDRSADLVLGAAVNICGTVSSAAGSPQAGLQVQLYRAAAYPKTVLATTTTGSAGTYCFSDLDAPENYIVELDYPSSSEPYATHRVTVRSASATIDFTVKVQS